MHQPEWHLAAVCGDPEHAYELVVAEGETVDGDGRPVLVEETALVQFGEPFD